ncbi:MAG TPA: MFS transporter [Planctomycetota bacterium]|nr:MFS transporter [Planctomycetota bacterium]
MPETLAPAIEPSQLDAIRRRGVRIAITMQCGSCLAIAALSNGQVLLYFNALGLSSITTMVLLALPSLVFAFTAIPSAYCSDSMGLKRIGRAGTTLSAIGFSLLPVAVFFPDRWQTPVLALGILIYAGGTALFSSCWYVIVDPLVDPTARGRFWGKLRFCWQLTALVFGMACALLVTDASPQWVLVAVIGIVSLGQWLRAVLFLGFPELVKSRVTPGGFVTAMMSAARTPGYLPFGSYVFLLTLFTAAAPTLFALIETKVLHYSDNTVVLMGAALMLGSVIGSLVAGPAVDRIGMKRVFIVCHFAYGLILTAFLLRGLVPFGEVYIGALNFSFAAVAAAAQVAISSEMLALLPAENKSLAVSILEMMRSWGAAASSLLSAAVLKIGFLKDDWRLGGLELSSYDALLLGCATMVVLCVVSLGLVPSVIRKAETFDRSVAP